MEKHYVAKKYIFCIFQLLIVTHLLGQVKQQVLPGIWHSVNSWSPIGIPTRIDSVIVVADLIIQESLTAIAKHVTVISTGNLTIENNMAMDSPGKLSINNSPGAGLANQGRLLNKGHIEINGATGKSIVNTGNIENITDAIVELKNQGDFGIWNLDTFMNFGNLKVQNSPAASIRNTDYFSNQGKMVIRNTQGIDNNGFFKNSDSLIMRLNTYGFINKDTMNNQSNGVLLIEDTQEIGFHNNMGSYCLNEGIYVIDSIHNLAIGKALLLEGRMDNKGSMDISGAVSGIELILDTLYCTQTSSINMYSTLNSLLVTGHFQNHGSVSFMGSLSRAIINSGNIENYGHLKTFDSGSIQNYESFYNHGKIECLNGRSTVSIENGNFMLNTDTIFISHPKRHGFENINDFTSDSLGVIIIENVDVGAAFKNRDSDAYFTNHGILKIDSTTEIAIECESSSYLENFGNIHIDQANTGVNIDDAAVLRNQLGSIITISNVEIGAEVMFSGLLQIAGYMNIAQSTEYGLKQGRDFESDPGDVIIDSTGELIILASSGIPVGIYIDAVFDCQGIFDAK